MLKLRNTNKRLWLVALGILIAATAASTFFLTSRSAADADSSAILSLISDFQGAEVGASTIPADAVSTVESAMAGVAASATRPVINQEKSPVQILSASARDEINQADATLFKSYCSTAFQQRHASDVPLADVVEAGLYNNPQEPLVLHEEQKLMAGEVMKDDGTTAIVWTYSWYGDITTNGNGQQGWGIDEYRVVKEGGQWRIDARTRLLDASAECQPGTVGDGPVGSILAAFLDGRRGAARSLRAVCG